MAHPQEVRNEILMLLDLGNSAYEIAKRTGIPRQTISRWEKEVFGVPGTSAYEHRRMLKATAKAERHRKRA